MWDLLLAIPIFFSPIIAATGGAHLLSQNRAKPVAYVLLTLGLIGIVGMLTGLWAVATGYIVAWLLQIVAR